MLPFQKRFISSFALLALVVLTFLSAGNINFFEKLEEPNEVSPLLSTLVPDTKAGNHSGPTSLPLKPTITPKGIQPASLSPNLIPQAKPEKTPSASYQPIKEPQQVAPPSQPVPSQVVIQFSQD